jgi:hypothetical protein
LRAKQALIDKGDFDAAANEDRALRELQRLVEDLAHRKLGQIARQPPQRA